MRFDLGDEHSLLRSSTRELLEQEAPLSEMRSVMEQSIEGYSKPLHSKRGDLGYPGLLLPEADGGMGPIAFAVVLEEMGRVALPGPFLDQALAVWLLAACENKVAAEWCRRAAKGDTLVVLARREGGARTARRVATPSFSDGRVQGRATFVPFGAQADALLVETNEGLVLAERPGTGWEAQDLPTLDHAQRFAEIELDVAGSLVADSSAARSALAKIDPLAALGAAAMLLGVMDRALEVTTAYLSERSAFGAPIGSFQALQHRCADMLLQTESARSAVYRASWAAESGAPDDAYLAAVAKAYAGPAARFVCGQAVQLHGGVGFTWEYDLHIYLKRTKTLEQFHGSTSSQIEAALLLRDAQ